MSVQGKINFILMRKRMSETPEDSTRKGSSCGTARGRVYKGLREKIHSTVPLRPRKMEIEKRI